MIADIVPAQMPKNKKGKGTINKQTLMRRKKPILTFQYSPYYVVQAHRLRHLSNYCDSLEVHA